MTTSSHVLDELCGRRESSRGTTSASASQGGTRRKRRAARAARCPRDRGARARRAISRRAVARPEDGRVPRPAREPRTRRRAWRVVARSTASAITARSRCISRAAPSTSSRSTFVRTRSRARRRTARRNGITNVEFVEADTFEYLTRTRDAPARVRHDRAGSARLREDARRAAGRASRLQGHQPSRDAHARRAADCCSPPAAAFISPSRSSSRCSQDAAADSGRRWCFARSRGSRSIIPRSLTIPETGYIKGALLEALD